ncbi:MAG: flagellar hook-associated protein FlgK, partial [Clostridia bacterium]
MRSTFFGIEMARRALSAHRTNADVIGHNLANAATEGYRKQRARLTPTEPYDQPGHPRMIIGSGVQVEEITRKQNRYLDREISSRTADHSLWSKRRELLAEIQDVLSEPGDTGIDSAMDRFWNSWDELAGSADDPALRSSLVERAGELGDSLRIALRQLNNMSDNLEQTIQTRVQKVNGILSELSDINGEVLALEARGLNANDMLDRRDVLVEELSELIDITVTDSDDGGITIDAGGIPVLDSYTSRSLELGDVTGGSGGSPAEVSFGWGTDGGSASEWAPGSGGELGALVDVRNGDLPGLIDDIVTLADTLRQSV